MTEQSPAKSILWYSTVESAENLEISVLAVLESICAVSLSLWLAWHFQSYTHIVVAIVLAPLLLLRTEESTQLGLKWFGGFREWYEEFIEWFVKLFSLTRNQQQHESTIFKLFLLLGLVVSIVLVVILWFKVSFWVWLIFTLTFLISWGYFLAILYNILKILSKFADKLLTIMPLIVLLVVAIVVSLVFIITQFLVITGVVIGGIVVSSLIIKFTATTLTFFCQPLTSLQAIPKNWYRIVLATDMRHPLELLPGIISTVL